jgi:TPR repeat protein
VERLLFCDQQGVLEMAAKSPGLQNQEAYYRPSGAVHFVRMFFMWLMVLAGLFSVLYFAVIPKLTEQAAVMTYERLAVEENARQAGNFIQRTESAALPSETEARWQLVIRDQVDGVLGRVEARLSEHYILLLLVTGITVTLVLALFSFLQATREEKSERELHKIRQDILADWGLVRKELDVIKNEHDKAWRDQDTARQELEKIRITLDSSLGELDRTRRDLDQSRKELDNSRKSLHAFRREQDSAKDVLTRMKQELDERDKKGRRELEDLAEQARTAVQNLLNYARSADSGAFTPPGGAESIFTAGQDAVQVAPPEEQEEDEGQVIALNKDQAVLPEREEQIAPAGAGAPRAAGLSLEDYRAMEHSALENLGASGDSMAVAELGYRYFMGIGVPVDHSVSVEYSRRAAEMGNATAQVDLGFMYMQGLGVPQDNQKAFEYYQKAADQQHDLGELNLGLLYVRGQGVRQDFVKAFEMFSRAARQGNVLGMLNLGVMYEQGDGVLRNCAKAIELYRMAAERGNVKAMLYLAEIYDLGNGTAMDPSRATHWFTMAANTGNTDAMLKVARRYMSGTGVQADSLTAYTYLLLYNSFEAAGEQSKVGALMEKFGAVLTPEQIEAAQAEATRIWMGIHGQKQQGGARGQ